MSAPIPLPIPWRDVAAYADYHGYDDWQTQFFDILCQCLDKIFCDHHHAKAAAKS